MRKELCRLLGSLALFVLPSCVTTPPPAPDVGSGQFEGNVFVMWVGEGGSSGDGRFLFVPDPKRPLTFRRPGGRGEPIRPHMMYTDGGSIPQAAQLFKGLSPWGYAPAYMIHDWLFVARHCLVDGDPDPRYAPMAAVDFADSRAILEEAIRALVAERRVAENDVAVTAISAGVSSPIARKMWERRGACAAEKVRPEHVAAAEAALPGSAGPLARGPLPADVGVRATIIDSIGF